MSRTVFPYSGNLTPSEIMAIVLNNDGAGSGIDADLLDGFSIEDFITNEELQTIIADLNNEAPSIVTKPAIVITVAPGATYGSISIVVPATLVNVDTNATINPIYTVEVSKSVTFEPENIVQTITGDYNTVNNYGLTTLDTSGIYYVRSRAEIDNHLSNWSFIYRFVGTGNVNAIVDPVVTVEGWPNSISTGPTIETGSYTTIPPVGSSVGSHLSTDWVVKDKNGNVSYSNYGDRVNLTKITLPLGTLDPDTEYDFFVRFNSSVDNSNYSKVTGKTSKTIYAGYFTDGPASVTGISSYGASKLAGNSILVTGGITPSQPASSTCFILDTNLNNGIGVYLNTLAMGTPRFSHAQSTLLNGMVLVSGGVDDNNNTLDTCELYTPAIGVNPASWTYTTSLPMERKQHDQVTLLDGRILIVGGSIPTSTATKTTLIYVPDPNTGAGTWVPGPDMNVGRRGCRATVLSDGRVLVVGGVNSTSQVLSSVEIFDPNGNNGAGEFTQIVDIPVARAYHGQALMIGSKVLVSGGENSVGTKLKNTYIFNPDGNNGNGVWYGARDMDTERTKIHGVSLDSGRIYMLMGSGTSGMLTTSEYYY